MNLLLYSHFLYPDIGGVEHASVVLASLFARRGIGVTVATRTRNRDPDRFHFPILRRPGLGALRRAVADSDVVYTMGFNPTCAALAGLQEKPLIWDHPDHDLICPKNIAWDGEDKSFDPPQCRACLARDWPPGYVLALPVHLRLRRWYARRRPLHVFHSQYALERARVEVGSLRALVLPRLAIPTPIPFGTEAERPPTFVVLTRLIPEKGCQVALRAVAEVPQATLDIIGEGWYRQELSSLARDLGIEERVNFWGPLPQGAAMRVVASSRALIVPSLWGEPFGQAVVQALALGIPVVASDAGGLPEVVGDAGLLFPRGNHLALADIMERFLGDPELERSLRSRALKAAPESRALGERYVSLVKELAEGSS